MKSSKKNAVLLAVAVFMLLVTNVLVLASSGGQGQKYQDEDKKIQALVLQLTDQQKEIQILMVNQNNLVQAHDVDLKSWKAMLESIQTEQKEILALDRRLKGAGR